MVPLTAALVTALVGTTYAQATSGSGRTAKHPETRTATQSGPVAVTVTADAGARQIALAYVAQHAGDFGLTATDVSDVVVMSDVVSEHSGVTHVYLRQRFNGIEVHGAEMNVNLTRSGMVFGAGTSFVGNLAAAISSTSAGLEPGELAALAEKHVGKSLKTAAAPTLVYEPLASGEVALAWLISVEEAASGRMWTMTLDASTGDLFEKNDLTVHDVWNEPDWHDVGGLTSRLLASSFDAPAASPADATIATTESPSTRIAAVPVPGVPGSGTYTVFAWPFADPNDGPRSIVVDPADALSSPFGWHDTDGQPGAESEQTVGNNVEAYVDVLNDNTPVDSDRATGVSGAFDFPIDFTQDPVTYQPAAITNLFYWTNFIHDVSYRYGFNEAAGNFQSNNYGRFDPADLSAPPDALRAEAQDGGGTDNANFTVAADNAVFPRPRLQMFLWVPVGGYEVQVQAGPAAGNYTAVRANFRPFLSDTAVPQPTAEVRLASPATGCAALVGFTAGAIAYVDAGGCTSIVKATNARNAGAVGIIINSGFTDALLPANSPLAGTSTGVGIPVLGISTNTAAILRPALPFIAKMAFLGVPAPLRDSDFDAGVILHEYTHGISNRLTGGRLTTSCLNNLEQMGEGWSDWLALALTHDPDRPDPRSRAIAPYLRFTGSDGAGLRGTRYTTDMSINSTTYGMLAAGALSVPNGVGLAWGTMLWEMYWNLIDRHGFNPNVYDSWDTGGNNLAIQLVMDGMKGQVCRPGFVDARNAILDADIALTGGANQCFIWRGFAKRGLGFSAAQGSSNSITDGIEAFDMPPLCQPAIDVTPAALTARQVQNTSSTQSLAIRNVTRDGGVDLNWTITETATDCSAPSDLPWLIVSSASGITPPNMTSETTVTFDATGLRGGFYTGKLCITGAGAATAEVPVSFNVLYDFQGFDGKFEEETVRVSAGNDVRVEFRLGGFQGMDIFAAASPASRQVDCTTGAPLGDLEPAIAKRRTALAFEDEYRWRWQSSATWNGSCREFALGLNDGTVRTKMIQFE